MQGYARGFLKQNRLLIPAVGALAVAMIGEQNHERISSSPAVRSACSSWPIRPSTISIMR